MKFTFYENVKNFLKLLTPEWRVIESSKFDRNIFWGIVNGGTILGQKVKKVSRLSYTSSSAVAERPRDALCPLVVIASTK